MSDYVRRRIAEAKAALPRLSPKQEQALARLVDEFGVEFIREAARTVRLRRPGTDPALLGDINFAKRIDLLAEKHRPTFGKGATLKKAFSDAFHEDHTPQEQKRAGAFQTYWDTGKKRRQRGHAALRKFKASEPFFDDDATLEQWAQGEGKQSR